jgi:hypothetical protein
MAANEGGLRKPMMRRRFSGLKCQHSMTYVHPLPLERFRFMCLQADVEQGCSFSRKEQLGSINYVEA